ncbi:MAG TPA: hypothetical protein VKG21_18120 [Casimicrobiaceae bacterium]|nr:hypothetical protein [Casimicrobiaceae bacterium]
MITLQSDEMTRRSFEQVPESYDSLPQTLGLDMVRVFDVQIVVDFGQSESLMAGISPQRRAARAKASEPVAQAFYDRKLRFVNLGNGIYPTATLAKRLGVPQAEVTAAFWKGAAVPAAELRTRGEAVRQIFAAGKKITLTHPNGTNLSFAVDAGHGIVSDGALTPEKVAKGTAAGSTWLPAGELILPAVPGSADGKVVIDKVLFDGKEIEALTLVYAKGQLTSMTAKSNLDGLKAVYDASGGAKSAFGWIDLGLNPGTRLPVGTGRVVWTVPGAITVGLGDNRGFGGTNASNFGLATQLAGATLQVDDKAVIQNGELK